MSSSEYHFITHWRVEGTPEEVYRLLDEPLDLVRWWPAVYLGAEETKTPEGSVYDLWTKGWLPYTLRWKFRRTQKVPFERIVLEAWGDFVGRGEWSFVADGPFVNITYDWRIRADKPLLRWLSWLLKPVFAWNHHWAMARGEESLKLELARQHAKTDEERACVPPPPGPKTSSWPLLLGLLAVLAVLAAAGYGIVSLVRG